MMLNADLNLNSPEVKEAQEGIRVEKVVILKPSEYLFRFATTSETGLPSPRPWWVGLENYQKILKVLKGMHHSGKKVSSPAFAGAGRQALAVPNRNLCEKLVRAYVCQPIKAFEGPPKDVVSSAWWEGPIMGLPGWEEVRQLFVPRVCVKGSNDEWSWTPTGREAFKEDRCLKLWEPSSQDRLEQLPRK